MGTKFSIFKRSANDVEERPLSSEDKPEDKPEPTQPTPNDETMSPDITSGVTEDKVCQKCECVECKCDHCQCPQEVEVKPMAQLAEDIAIEKQSTDASNEGMASDVIVTEALIENLSKMNVTDEEVAAKEEVIATKTEDPIPEVKAEVTEINAKKCLCDPCVCDPCLCGAHEVNTQSMSNESDLIQISEPIIESEPQESEPAVGDKSEEQQNQTVPEMEIHETEVQPPVCESDSCVTYEQWLHKDTTNVSIDSNNN